MHANLFRGWETSAMVYGVEKITDNQKEMYRAVIDKMINTMDAGGNGKRIKPVTVDKNTAPCKEVIIKGDDVDITKFPWFKNNPADVGQYVNTGAVFMEDPQLGRNVGTYRCQVKGPKKIGVNPEVGQHGWIFMMKAKQRGEKIKQVARECGIPTVENKPLAQALFKAVDIGDAIPEELYRAVAEILAYVFRLKERQPA